MRESRKQDDLGRWIYPAALPNGGSIRLLKVLLTNVCEKNCYYWRESAHGAMCRGPASRTTSWHAL